MGTDIGIFICPVCEAVIEGDLSCPNGPHADPQVEPSSWRCPCGCGSTTGCFVYSGDDDPDDIGRAVGDV